MSTSNLHESLRRLFSELTDGTTVGGGAYVLNSGDIGLLRSLEKLTAEEASSSTNGGATIAAHAQHLRYGLSLMNRWAAEGGNPFADAKWDEAWKVSVVGEEAWAGIRRALREQTSRWLEALAQPRDTEQVALNGMIGSVVHLAYHLGAIRQIARAARGPREGTFS